MLLDYMIREIEPEIEPEIEVLDLMNIFEVQKIREILIHHPDLLSMFELLVVMGNNRLNDEKAED